MNDQKSQTGKRAPVNSKTPWYVSLLQGMGVSLKGLTKRRVRDMATAKLGRRKHAGGRKRHATRRAPGRSARHVRTMGRQ